MAVGFQYIACHPLSRVQLAPPLRVSSASWTETVNGNGTGTFKITLPRSTTARDLLKVALEPDDSAIYVHDTTLGSYPWGGIVRQQDWNPDDNTITVTVVEWRSWLFGVLLEPKLDLSADNVYSWLAKDQLQIARELVGFAVAGGSADGRPAVTIGGELSGKLRDLNIKGLDFKYVGELLDMISNRDGGFEWSLDIIPDDSDHLPRLKLGLYYPERGGIIDGMLLKHAPPGSNMKLSSSLTRNTDSRFTRVWTTGSGEQLPFSVDSDPDLSGGQLLREKVTNYSNVTDRTTLASHARAERVFLNPKVALIAVELGENKPPLNTYRAGDRTRLLYEDSWVSYDLEAVRIVERRLEPNSGAGKVTLTLDLSDDMPPEVDTGGTV